MARDVREGGRHVLVLGLDPGSALTGLCRLDVPRSGKARWIQSAHADLATVLDVLRVTLPETVVAIETPIQIHPGIARNRGVGAALSIGKHIAATREIVGQIKGACGVLGLGYVEGTANEWRAAICGASGASNARVAKALGWRVEMPARSNEHERDAAGIALWAGLRAWANVRRTG